MAISAAPPIANLMDVESTDEGSAAPPPVVKKKQSVKAVKRDASKKRKSLPTPVQKNTLDGWFGVAKKPTAIEKSMVKSNSNAVLKEVEFEASPLLKKPFRNASRSKTQQKSKKMVQRRILLSDECRVCENAKTKISTRCERKCMDCEMTVHMSCYGVEEDDEMLPEKWRCRPCQATYDLTAPKPEVGEDSVDESEQEPTVVGIPVHEPRSGGDPFDGLYQCSDFAAVFLFLKRFRRLGLNLGADITVRVLATALLAPRDHAVLQDLHTRLLQNVGATISKNGTWVDNLIRFLKVSEYPIGGELMRRLAACGDANDWLSTYYDVTIMDRVALLKVLCEAQFDENDTLIEKLGSDDTPPESLRDETLGVDALKRSYYLLEDSSNFSDGSAWLCRCQALDGSNWETVSDDLASLRSFVLALSYSNETLDLQLWQTIANGVAKSLERREKKKQQQAQRLAHMPRLLRGSGLDMTSILPENSISNGRSLRTRKAVNYRSYDDYAEEDEDSEADEPNDDEEEDDEEEEEEEVEDDHLENGSISDGRGRNKRRRLRVEQPTRTSQRLRRSPHRRETNSSDESDSDDNVNEAANREDDEEEEDVGSGGEN